MPHYHIGYIFATIACAEGSSIKVRAKPIYAVLIKENKELSLVHLNTSLLVLTLFFLAFDIKFGR